MAHADDGYQMGALLGTAVPMNRRAGQVPQLSGGSLSLSGGLAHRRDIRMGVDLDSLASDVAMHVSLSAWGAFHWRIN